MIREEQLSMIEYALYCIVLYCIGKLPVGGLLRNSVLNKSRLVGKPAFCICENKDADQLHGNRAADQRLCFRYIDCTIPLLPKSEISSF